MYYNLIKRSVERFKSANLLDDLKFRKVSESKEAIEEILRTILNDEKLVVLEVLKQSTEEEPLFHGVILDCKCILVTEEIVNIEIQVSHNDNPLYRMRYNGSMLTIENSPKKKNYKYSEIPHLILIMFCEFDIFDIDKPIYEIVRYVKDTDIIADDGVRELYVNLKSKVTDKYLKSLFRIMTTVNDVDKKLFPKLSMIKENINKLYIGGEDNMNGVLLEAYKDGVEEGIEQGIEQGIEKGKNDLLHELIEKGIITNEQVEKLSKE